jgi:hypothetical protein
MSKLEGKVAVITGGNSGNRPCYGTTLRRGGRVHLYHGPPSGRTRRSSKADR